MEGGEGREGVGGWEAGRRGKGWGGGEGGGQSSPGVDTPTDGPDHTTRPKGHHSSQG